MKEELQSLKIPPEKIQFIPNGVSLPTEVNFAVGVKELYRAKLNLPYKQIVVFTGRLSAEKGLDTLVRAWVKVHRQHPEAHLLILGEGIGKQVNFKAEFGNIENELRSLLASLNLDNVVHLLGFKPNPTDYLLAANLFVLPSRSEAMSVSLIEAMASGTAVIASDIRGNHALCENEVNSLLFPLEDETALAQVIVRVLSNSEVEEKLGRAARKKAESDLTVEVMTDRYLNLYSSLK
jgi:glycosyltransferase involved in cell wall biosynthesis